MIKFNERFKEAREYYGLNKSDFAKKIGIAPSTVARYENGSMDIAIGAVAEVANKLSISLPWLLGLSDNMYDVEITQKKIPVLGTIKKMPVMDFENFNGFEILKETYKVDFCVKDKETQLSTGKAITIFFQRVKSEQLSNGDTVAVLDGNNLVVRKYYKYGKQIVLRDRNENEFLTDSANIIGRATLTLSEA